MARVWDEVVWRARWKDLGNVVRLHRELRGAKWPWWAGGVAVIVMTSVPFFLRGATFPFWQLLPLLWSLPIGATLLWQYLAPVRNRRWYAVASGGLLVYSPKRPLIAIPWKELRRGESRFSQRAGGKSMPLEIPPVSGRADLILALRSRGVLPSTLRWLPAWPERGLAVVVVLWLVGVPLAISALTDWRPPSLARLTDLCENGEPFAGSPRYEGEGPHPMAVAGIATEPTEVWGAEGGAEPAASDVQLVGCVRFIGQSSVAEECRYDEDFVQTIYQGRYRVDVLEVRTGRNIDSFNVNGVAPTCAYLVSVDEGTEEGEYDTVPDRAAYEDHVMPLVTEPAG